jgi:hypothetical protein
LEFFEAFLGGFFEGGGGEVVEVFGFLLDFPIAFLLEF